MCTIPVSHETQKNNIYETNGIQEPKTRFQSGKLRGTNTTEERACIKKGRIAYNLNEL